MTGPAGNDPEATDPEATDPGIAGLGMNAPAGTGGGVAWRAAIIALVADLAAVAVFVLVGRQSHGGDVAGFAAAAAPFALGLAAAWVIAALFWRPASWQPLSPRWALIVWPVTVAAGLLVRAAFTGRLPWTFALVTALSLGVLLLGWRAVVWAVRRVRSMRS